MSIVFACGGTGGHIFPALALAEELKVQGENEIIFIGVGKELEARLIPEEFERVSIPFFPVLGKGIGGLIRVAFQFPLALYRALLLYRRIRPKVVLGFGGYPSFVPLLAAYLLRIPRALHEQNVHVGLANRALSLFAQVIFAPPGADGFWRSSNIVSSGNPVRAEIYRVSPYQGLQAGRGLRILVLGGSQGALRLSQAICDLVPFWLEHSIELRHQTGKQHYEDIKARYEEQNFEQVCIFPFIDDILSSYQWADLVVCRAGAMTVAEVLTTCRPMILVPLSIAGGHQRANAEIASSLGAGLIVEDNSELSSKLSEEIGKLLSQPEKLSEMSENARSKYLKDGTPLAKLVVERVLGLANS